MGAGTRAILVKDQRNEQNACKNTYLIPVSLTHCIAKRSFALSLFTQRM
jgi:hypothetical protein